MHMKVRTLIAGLFIPAAMCAQTDFVNIFLGKHFRFCLSLALSSVLVGTIHAQSVRAYRQSNEKQIVQELIDLLALPNVAQDNVNIRRNAQKIVDMLRQRGVKTRLLEHSRRNVPPVVFGELKALGAKETVMFYCHYDGQPADSTKWADAGPWEPIVRTNTLDSGGTVISLSPESGKIEGNWRVYARSASDDKSPIVVLMAALDALSAQGTQPSVNLKFFFEGEEEAGSPHLGDFLRQHKNLLEADIWITADGPVHQNGQKLVFFGCRGIVSAEITVYGANRPLHSGHYGNWAPNPAMNLSKLLTTMKDDAGNVLIPGFYDDVAPLGHLEKQAIAKSPDYDKTLAGELGFARPEGAGKSLNELINLPSLNVSGLSSGYVGSQSRTAVPSSATARIDMRLVKGNDPDRQVERLKEHIRRQGYHIVSDDPSLAERLNHSLIAKITKSDGYKAHRTPMDLPIAGKIVHALKSLPFGDIVLMPTVGGSVPLSLIAEITGAPQLVVPIANYDNNQHSENENVRIQNLWDGIEMYAAIMTME